MGHRIYTDAKSGRLEGVDSSLPLKDLEAGFGQTRYRSAFRSRIQTLKRALLPPHRLARYLLLLVVLGALFFFVTPRMSAEMAQPPAGPQANVTSPVVFEEDTASEAKLAVDHTNRLDDHLALGPNLISSRYAPLSLTNCTPSMPTYYAPCVARSHAHLARLVEGEELVYPDFAVPFPIFTKDAHRKRWIDALPTIAGRASPMYNMAEDTDWMVYKSQHGQNFVFHDVEFTPSSSYDGWTEHASMSNPTIGSLDIQPRNESVSDDRANNTALLVNSPDSWSFQHFIDRVTHVIAQASHLYDDQPIALTGRKGNNLVNALWSKLGFESEHVQHERRETMSLARLYHSCKAVLIHPYLTWRSAEIMKMPWADPAYDPSTKKTVFYMTRSNGKASNGGRRVLNEDDIISSIQDVLTERNKTEQLVIFDPDSYENVDDLIETLSRDALAIVGPHGGAMMNHRFAGPGTLVLEFLPTSWMLFENFEESSMMSQSYAAILVEPEPGTPHDMRIDPADVAAILREHLGQTRKAALRLEYNWAKE